MIKLLRKTSFETFEGYFLKKLAKEIEDDLRTVVHSSFIEGLESTSYSDVNLNTYLNIKNFKFFDKVISIRRYIEEHLNMNFYKLTTLNLNNAQTYQKMRVLAKHKYGLNLHEVILPNQNLEQGKDILDIIRNLNKFAKSYTHNMHSQIFIEINNGSSYINVIGVQQIINSLNTHGKGIVNSIINKAFGYISKSIKNLLGILFDDYILSLLKDEKTFWEQNKATIKYNYPLERAMSLRQKIINLDENKVVNNISKCIQFITQIGNAVALSRCIRTALMDYNSQNVNLLTSYNIDDFNNLVQQLILQVKSDPVNPNVNNISPNMLSNTQNSLNDSNRLFCDMVNSLKQTGEINYLQVLVTSFQGSLSPEKVPDIDLFAFLLPPLTITFIDNAINARDNLLKKNKSEEMAYFSDDGFMMGVCYLLKVFSADKKFESLSWFPSVISYYNAQKIQRKNEKGSHGVDTLNERQITSYKEQFELQYFTYTSAAILFNE
jgi:WASH complex subunit 7